MFRCASRCFFSLVILAAVHAGLSFEQPAEKDDAPFRWLEPTGETSGIKFATYKLESLSPGTETGPAVEIEQEETKVNAQTTRIARRVFDNSVNGERQLAETVVEEIQKMPGGRVRAVRTTSRRDANGRLSPVQKDIQEVTPSGTDGCRIERTIFQPGNGGQLVEKERIQQTERRKGQQNVDIDRIQYVPDLNGSWSAAERRVSQNTVTENRVSTNEQVYRYDVNNRLSLNQRITGTEWKDSGGQTHRQSESYTSDLQGELQLSSRRTMIQTPLAEGRQQTTETLERPSPLAPNEGLKLVRKIVEDVTVHSPGETERQLEVLEPDLNGGMRSIQNRQDIEVR
jgi:hypothetical protein